MTGTQTVRISRSALREARARRKLSQMDLSLRSGVGQSYISRLESGSREAIRILMLRALAQALAVEPDHLISSDQPE